MAKLVITVTMSDDGEMILPPDILNAMGMEGSATLIFDVVDGEANITVDRPTAEATEIT